MRIVAIALLFAACSGQRSAADLPATDATPGDAAPVAADEPAEHVGPAPVPTADPVADVAPTTPASLYQGCRERLEGVESAGECTTDADCTKVGCSQEVCVATSRAGEVMSTCEVLPCFRAVDACGCHEGVCSWTVKSDLAGPTPGRVPLPAK